jgi:DNA-binding IclR family transcriptional regulator
MSQSGTRKQKKSAKGVQVIARAAEIMRILAEGKGLSLSDLSESVGLPRSTVHRIVIALEAEGLVTRNGPGSYRVGPSVVALAEVSKTSVVHELRPHLVRLSNELNETVDLSLLTGHTVMFVDQVIAPQRLRAVSAIGVSFPLHCTANGKAILASLPEQALEDLLPKRLEQFTPSTHGNRADLLKELIEVRRTGIAFDRQEHTVGICALGSSLRLDRRDWLAISLPLPAERFYGQEARLAAALKRCCGEIVITVPRLERFPNHTEQRGRSKALAT